MNDTHRDQLEDIEIAPLSDEDLEDVSGGAMDGSSDSCCSCCSCSTEPDCDGESPSFA